MAERLEVLKALVAQNPGDSFSRYGLAMEYAKLGELERAAAEYESLVATNPEYAAAYYQGGQVFERLGKTDKAKEFYRKGIEVTGRQGNQHAQNELQIALDLLG